MSAGHCPALCGGALGELGEGWTAVFERLAKQWDVFRDPGGTLAAWAPGVSLTLRGGTEEDAHGLPRGSIRNGNVWQEEGLGLDREESLRRSVWGCLLESLVKVAIWHDGVPGDFKAQENMARPWFKKVLNIFKRLLFRWQGCASFFL